MSSELEALRDLADPDTTVQRIAAARAHKVLRSSPALLAALERLLVHEDKYLRRAAASSYVVLHPAGAKAPALQPLHGDPADVVVLTARGALLDPAHEIAELAFVVRALARATGAAFTCSQTAARWHKFLWLYSPNPRAATVMQLVTSEALDRDGDALRDALAASLRVPDAVTQLQIELDEQLVIHGSVDGRHAWSAEIPVSLGAFRALASAAWDPHDTPWPAMFAAGCFALAVARAAETTPSSYAGRELATRIAGGESIFVGFAGATGLSYTE